MPKLIDLSQSPRPVPQDVGGPISIPTIDSGAGAIGAGTTQLGSGISGGADQMFQAQKVEEDRINTLRAEEAFTQLRDKQLDLTVGDNGFSKVRGAAAVSKPLYQEWGAKFQDAQQQIAAGLSNADQRDKFTARAGVARIQFHEDMLHHLSRESDSYAKEVYSSILASEHGNAIARWDDPNSMAASIVRIDAAVDREGERSGWSDGEIATTKQAQASAIYRGTIGMMVDNAQERKAQDFYTAVKSKLTAGDQLAVQTALVHARKQIEDDTWEGVADGIQSLEHQVFMDPAQYDESLASGKETIDGLKDVQERNRVKYRHNLYERLATANVLGQARTDPEGTLAMLRGDTRGPIQGGIPEGEPNRANLEAYAAQQENINDLPPGLLRAVIEKESNWEHWKSKGVLNTSKKGAVGLGQLMPDTAAGEGVDPSDPYANIRGAASYLAKQLERFNGDVPKALAAYNAGPERVAEYGGIPPFKETQDYVPDVQARAEIYQQQGAVEPEVGMTNTNTGDDFIDKMPLHLRVQLTHEVNTMVNQGQAKLRHQLKGKVEDFMAMAHSRTDIPLGSIPTQSEITKAYGTDAPAMWKEVQGALVLNSDIKQSISMPRADQDARFSALTPQPGPGYLDAFKRQNAYGSAIDAIRKEQDADPAGWTIRNTKPVRDSFSAAQNAITEAGANPNDQAKQAAVRPAIENYALATLAEQDRIGMAPRLLPTDMKDAIVQTFYKGQKEGGQPAAQMIQQLNDQWGKYWPQVYREIGKDIPSGARTIGAGMPETAAMRLSQLADVKADDLKVGMATADVTAIHEQLVSNFTNARISLVATNARSGQEMADSTFKDAEKLALSYHAQGKSPKESANQAYAETFGHRYDFVSSGPAYYRVPKGGPDWQTPNAITAGATVTQANVGNLNIQPPTNLSGLKPQEALEQYKAVIAAKGYWVNDETESGLVLMNPQGNPVLDASSRPGKPVLIQKSWYDLYTAGKNIGGKTPVGPGGGTVFPTSPAPVAPTSPNPESTPQTSAPQATKYGLREDGTPKGEGYFGTLKREGGGVSGELSIGVEFDGKEHLIPSMVPTLNSSELHWLLTHDGQDKMPQSIVSKATDFAKDRIASGKSVWAEPGEKYPLPTPAEMRSDQTAEPITQAEPREMQGGETAQEVSQLARPISQATPKRYTREYTQDGEPVVDTFPPGSKPGSKPDNFDSVEKQLRSLAAREDQAGQLAAQARDNGDKEGWTRRTDTLNKMFKDRQALLAKLRKLDPKRADQVYNDLYLK